MADVGFQEQWLAARAQRRRDFRALLSSARMVDIPDGIGILVGDGVFTIIPPDGMTDGIGWIVEVLNEVRDNG